AKRQVVGQFAAQLLRIKAKNRRHEVLAPPGGAKGRTP
ncbi:MAG: hypothetical protein ACI81P_003475, partial [Neolewinella sp.]